MNSFSDFSKLFHNLIYLQHCYYTGYDMGVLYENVCVSVYVMCMCVCFADATPEETI